MDNLLTRNIRQIPPQSKDTITTKGIAFLKLIFIRHTVAGAKNRVNKNRGEPVISEVRFTKLIVPRKFLTTKVKCCGIMQKHRNIIRMPAMEEIRQDDTSQQVAVFAALADRTRLNLLKLLCHESTGSLCVSALSLLLGITQSATSQHLRVLRSIGLVAGERRGYRIHYSVNQEALKRCREILASALEVPESHRE